MNSFASLADMCADEPAPKRVELMARCTSKTCCRYDAGGKWRFKAYVPLSVRRGTIDCPACKSAIYWYNPSMDEMEGTLNDKSIR